MIHQSVEKIAQVETQANPFPGLRPFELHESYLFFGRDGQSEQLIAKLARNHFLAVVGTSGSGKSSLVRAGLLPALLTGFMSSAGSNWRMAIMRPGHSPIGNLAQALCDPEVFGAEHVDNRAVQTAITEATLRRGTLGLVDVATQNAMPAGENLLVLADQFEEIFRFAQTAKDPRYENEAAAFVKLLLEASRQKAVKIYVVLTMRSDYLGDCAQFQYLPEAINEAQYLIPRLTRDQRREAITGPVAVAGGEITPRLVNRLLNDVGDNPDQLPILQHALMRTWDEWERERDRDAERQSVGAGNASAALCSLPSLDLRHYEAIGGMAAALSLHADEAWSELPDDRSRLICARLFKCLTEKGPDNREMRRPITLGEAAAIVGATAQEVSAVIEPFRQPGRAFLMPPAAVELSGEALIDISHESLIRNWQRLRDWVEEETRSARIYRRLAETAALHREGKAGLWGDPDLQLALDWQDQNRPNANWARRYEADFDTAISFLQASEQKRAGDLAEAERRQRAEAERTRRELAQAQALAEAERQKAEEQQQYLEAQQRSGARLRRLLGALAVLALLAVVIAAMAYTFFRGEEGQRIRADSALVESRKQLVESLVHASTGFLSTNTEVDDLASLKSAVRAAQVVHTLPQATPRLQSEVWSALQQAVYGTRERNRIQLDARITSAAFSADGRRLAAITRDGRIYVWDRSGKQLAQFPGPSGRIAVTLARFSAGLEFLVTVHSPVAPEGGNTSRVLVWDLNQQSQMAEMKSLDRGFEAVSIHPQGKYIATAGEGGLRIWNLQGQQLTNFGNFPERAVSVDFSKEGDKLAWGSTAGIRVLDLARPERVLYIIRFPPSQAGAWYGRAPVTFLPGGTRIAVEDQLWDLTPKRVGSVKGDVFSPDGSLVAASTEVVVPQVFDHQDGQLVAELHGHRAGGAVQAIGPDHAVLTAGEDRTIRLWDVGPHYVAEFKTSGTQDMAISDPPRVLATADTSDEGSKSGTVRHHAVTLWRADGTKLGEFPGESGYSDARIFLSPDARSLVVVLEPSGAARLWNTQSHGHKEIHPQSTTSAVIGVTFSLPEPQLVMRDADAISLQDWSGAIRRFSIGVSPFSVELNMDGTHIVATSATGVSVWDLNGKRLSGFEKNLEGYTTVLPGSDVKRIALQRGEEGDVLVYDQNGTQIAHFGTIVSGVLSPDGRLLAAMSSYQYTVPTLWDVETELPVARFQGSGDVVLKFSNDGKYIMVAAAYDNAAGTRTPLPPRLWRVESPEELVSKACPWLEDYLQNGPDVSREDRALCSRLTTP